MNRQGKSGSHDYDYSDALDANEIETEIIDSRDDYFSSESPKPTSDDENSLKGGDSLLMPIVRNRSSSNSEVCQETDAIPVFEQSTTTKKMVTSGHTPAANILMNLGGRIRTNFRSFVNRRENAYATTEQNISIPLQLRNRRPSSNADNFSSIPAGDSGRAQNMTAKLDIDTYEVYDGTQVNLHTAERSVVTRSPSVGPPSSTSKRQLKLRSSSEIRKSRINFYEEK